MTRSAAEWRHKHGDHRRCDGPCRWWWLLVHYTDAPALLELARGTDCRDWPILYALAVETAGPLARSRISSVRSFEAFDVLHDRLWTRCRRCGRAECSRCYPVEGQRPRAVA